MAASDTVKYARLSSMTGLIFAVLFVVALVLVHTTPTLSASDADITAYYASSSTLLVTVGIYLIPFAGIAFMIPVPCKAPSSAAQYSDTSGVPSPPQAHAR